ncbi:MAG: S41 family peptidase [Imperialibacter sp.]|uniref:S41 family peptidase n=1 Tax=Imperialibacter sp. TaxID=2038411 RepID=UPI0032EAD36D
MPSLVIRLLPSLLLTISFSTWAQEVQTPRQAYEYLQNERHRAQALGIETEHPPADSLQKAIRILQEALQYYHRPEVEALAQAYDPLFYRESDILFDLAKVQLNAGQPTSAVESLDKILTKPYGHIYADLIQKDTIFSPIRHDSAFVSALAKSQAVRRVFHSDALKTPYAPNISEAEKIAGLSKFWAEAKYNFVYFDQVPELEWDQLYLEYLPKVQATSSTLEYFRVMQEFCAQLQDGHTSVWPTAEPLANLVYGRPAFLTRLVEDKVLVDEVFSDSLEQLGIRFGVEVVHIDGVPVQEYAIQHIQPYQNGSTPQNVVVGTYTYELLRGPKDQPVEVTFKGANGLFRHSLPRSGYSDYHATPAFRLRVLPGNIAYVELNNFDNDEAWKRFEVAFDSVAATDALILDVRRNGGGDSSYGWNILGCLTDSAFRIGAYSWRLYSPMRRNNILGQQYKISSQGTWLSQKGKSYTKPVVVLTSGRTFSAAEDFVVAFDAMKRGKLIGETTGGSTGYPLEFDLPGGLKARVCMKRDTYPDGQEWVGVGLKPDIVVRPKAADLQAGRDTVLEAALEYLEKL